MNDQISMADQLFVHMNKSRQACDRKKAVEQKVLEINGPPSFSSLISIINVLLEFPLRRVDRNVNFIAKILYSSYLC